MIELPLNSAELVLISIFLPVIMKMILFRLAGVFVILYCRLNLRKLIPGEKLSVFFCNIGLM